VSDHEDDLLSDLLRFFPQFGTQPFETMPGPTFFALATRIAAYGGVMAYRMQEHQASQPVSPAFADPEPEEVVSLAAFRAMFPDLIEVGSG
jgi:hypothetical protein